MECKSLRDAAKDLKELKIKAYGISRDDVKQMAAFVKKESLDFPQLSDPDGSVVKKYGVDGRRGYPKRRTFIIDEQGVLRAVVEKVNVRKHGPQIIEMIKELRAKK